MSTAPNGWQTPKTNWQPVEVFQQTDANRIEGNINSIETGSRTLDQTQAPTGNTGTLRQYLDWFANRIKAITGKANWYEAPANTIEQLSQIQRYSRLFYGDLWVSGVSYQTYESQTYRNISIVLPGNLFSLVNGVPVTSMVGEVSIWTISYTLRSRDSGFTAYAKVGISVNGGAETFTPERSVTGTNPTTFTETINLAASGYVTINFYFRSSYGGAVYLEYPKITGEIKTQVS